MTQSPHAAPASGGVADPAVAAAVRGVARQHDRPPHDLGQRHIRAQLAQFRRRHQAHRYRPAGDHIQWRARLALPGGGAAQARLPMAQS